MGENLLDGAHGRTALLGPDPCGLQMHLYKSNFDSSMVYAHFLPEVNAASKYLAIVRVYWGYLLEK